MTCRPAQPDNQTSPSRHIPYHSGPRLALRMLPVLVWTATAGPALGLGRPGLQQVYTWRIAVGKGLICQCTASFTFSSLAQCFTMVT